MGYRSSRSPRAHPYTFTQIKIGNMPFVSTAPLASNQVTNGIIQFSFLQAQTVLESSAWCRFVPLFPLACLI